VDWAKGAATVRPIAAEMPSDATVDFMRGVTAAGGALCLGACTVLVPLPSEVVEGDAAAPAVGPPNASGMDAAAQEVDDDAQGCWQLPVPREMVPPQAIIAFDRSSTMTTRVELIRKELVPALATLEGAAAFGYLEFPDKACDPAVGCCGASDILVPPALGASATIGKQLACDANGRKCVEGPPRTPSDDALRKLETFYRNGASTDADRFVVMITDGAPNCGGFGDPCDKARVAARDLWQDSRLRVKTAILAISTEARFSCLRAIAEVGGNVFEPATASDLPFVYVDTVTNPAVVRAALAQVLEPVKARTCVVKLAGSRDRPSEITVKVDGATLKYDPSHADGWDYDAGTDTRQIRIYGPRCAQALMGQLQPSSVQGIVTCSACGDRIDCSPRSDGGVRR
jgi:hypothetical protein